MRPGFAACAPSKGALFKTKEFAFQQRAGNCGAVHFYKRAAGPRRSVVDEPCQDLFAGAALTEDQNRNIQRSGPLDSLPHGLHRLRRTEVDVIRRQFDRRSRVFGFEFCGRSH